MKNLDNKLNENQLQSLGMLLEHELSNQIKSLKGSDDIHSNVIAQKMVEISQDIVWDKTPEQIAINDVACQKIRTYAKMLPLYTVQSFLSLLLNDKIKAKTDSI